jgi:hypothetical protein
MRMRLQSLLPSVLLVTVVVLLAVPLAAAAQEPAVSMSPESVGPGTTVEISGSAFPAGSAVKLQLTTPDGMQQLATVTTGPDGAFRELVALPLGATKGAWQLQAIAVDGTTSGLTFDTASEAADAATGPAAATEPAPTVRSGNTGGDIAVLLIIAVVLGGIAFGGVMVLRQRREDSPPGMGKGDDLIWGGGSADAPERTATDEPHWKRAETTTHPARTDS